MASAMQRLRAELAEARAIYDGRERTPDGESGRKAGAVNAIDAVMTFLAASDIPRGDQQPLEDVLAAFRDHKRGRPNSLFDKVKKPGGGTHSQRATWRAVIAATVTLLVRAKVKKRDALANVADSLNKAGFADISKTKVDTWHREISSERHADPGAIQIYHSTLAKSAEVHPGNPRSGAEDLLAGLPSLGPPPEL